MFGRGGGSDGGRKSDRCDGDDELSFHGQCPNCSAPCNLKADDCENVPLNPGQVTVGWCTPLKISCAAMYGPQHMRSRCQDRILRKRDPFHRIPACSLSAFDLRHGGSCRASSRDELDVRIAHDKQRRSTREERRTVAHIGVRGCVTQNLFARESELMPPTGNGNSRALAFSMLEGRPQ